MYCPFCGATTPELDRPCPSCGKVGMPRSAGAVARQGNVLYIPAGASLPDFCIRCNVPAEGDPKKVKLSWHPPALIALLFLGLLPYVIVALIMTKKATIYVPLCSEHRSSWTMAATIGLILLLAAIGAFVGLLVLDANHTGSGKGAMDRAIDSGTCFLIPLFGLAGMITLFLGIRNVTPKKIDAAGNAWIKGVGKDYLDAHAGVA